MLKLKTYLFALPLLLITTIASGQNLDTSKVWIPRQDALKVLAKAQQAQIFEQQIAQYKKDIDTLTTGIKLLQSIVDTLKSQRTNYEGLIFTYEKRISTMEEQRKLYDYQVNNLSTLYKKQKRKTRWVGFAGIAAVIGTIFLIK